MQTNRSAPLLFSRLVDLDAIPQPRNLLRTMFGPMRPWVENWDAVAHALGQRVFRESVSGVPDERTLALLQELGAWPPAPFGEQGGGAPQPFHPVIFKKEDLRLSFFSMIYSVGAPLDITAQELRIEAFFPADEATEVFAREHLRPERPG